MEGQGSSTPHDGGYVNKYSTRCHYEVLGLQHNASDSDIKKAYRKKALELHPDRNFGDVENATAKFAETQAAYEVLIDKDLRKCYDSDRKHLLKEKKTTNWEEINLDIRYKVANDIYDLSKKLTKKLLYNDEPSGFYRFLSKTFEEIAGDENSICHSLGLEPIIYPSFGSAYDNYGTSVKQFYQVWKNFSTQRKNASQFLYVSDSNHKGRRQRSALRHIEMKNSKLRKGSIKEFNNAVRDFVNIVRDRDPRYASNVKSSKSHCEALRCAAAAQSVRSRADNQAKSANYTVPDWVNFRDPADQEEVEEFILKSEESELECIDCIVCRKTFKSSAQYREHEKSKKHMKAVKQLKWELEDDMSLLNLESIKHVEPSYHVEHIMNS